MAPLDLAKKNPFSALSPFSPLFIPASAAHPGPAAPLPETMGGLAPK